MAIDIQVRFPTVERVQLQDLSVGDVFTTHQNIEGREGTPFVYMITNEKGSGSYRRCVCLNTGDICDLPMYSRVIELDVTSILCVHAKDSHLPF